MKRLPLVDYGKLRFELPAFLISHPECWDVRLSEIFKGRDDAAIEEEKQG